MTELDRLRKENVSLRECLERVSRLAELLYYKHRAVWQAANAKDSDIDDLCNGMYPLHWMKLAMEGVETDPRDPMPDPPTERETGSGPYDPTDNGCGCLQRWCRVCG